MTSVSKICDTCKVEKPLSEYYKSYKYLSGVRNKCKACFCRETRGNHRKRYPYDKARMRIKKAKRIKSGECLKDTYKHIEKYPEKNKARYTLRNAVTSGKVIKLPCVVCGNPKSEGHHKDYTKPLEVIWYCSKHHGEAHWKP